MFNLENGFFDVLGKIVDMIILGALWFVMCLPIITIGAATTAAYYVTFNQLNGKDGYVVRSFFKSFRENFKQATILFSIIAILSTFAIANIYILDNYISLGKAGFILRIVQLFVLVESLLLFIYGFSLLSKISFSFKNLFLTAFQMANRHIFESILSIVVVVGLFFAILYFPILFLFGGAIYFILTATILRFVIKKYRPDVFDTEIKDDVFVLDNNHSDFFL